MAVADIRPQAPAKPDGYLVAPVIFPMRGNSAVGIDWLTLFIDVEDDFPDVDDGVVERVNGAGEIQWTVRPSLKVRGSFEAGVQVRTETRINEPGRRLKIDGNPTKFILGHNVTPAPGHNVPGLCQVFVGLICRFLGLPLPRGRQRITRIDITAMCPLASRQEADSVLKALADQSLTAYRGRATRVQNTVYFGTPGSQTWFGKAYLKSVEIESRSKKHRLDDALGAVLIERLKQWADPCIRIEFQLRAKELDRLQLSDPSNFSPCTCEDLYMRYAAKVQINQPTHLDHNAVNSLPAHLQRVYLAWHSGHQLALTTSTLYRNRAAILKATGVDVFIPRTQREQAVRLQKVIQLKPAAPPAWAFEHIRLAA